ncbi:MAG: hypothetical protein DI586_04595 [Micavibrio aeruginosavorus]|uniref:Flagellar basal-body/hook protein C-terminal domain-containing protein n=1 Tax=Micavibrio aeruginosavorus TaxID=349221 RepID=A0A2W5FMG2_9BACT|nr:MAG: hypothetical protein DI586_04595 [Micavibrio aeruginosavorus]
MINPLSTSLSGMMNATKKLDSAAQNIANANSEGSEVSLDQEVLKTMQAQQDFEANAVVLSRTASMQKVLGSIFDETV